MVSEIERESRRYAGMVDSLLQVLVFVNAEKNFHCALSVAALPSLFCDIKNRKTNTINICFLSRYFFMRQILLARISKFY
jgi:hypothetical protein